MAAAELRRSGRHVRLQPKPFEILRVLLDEPGRVVTRTALIAKLWPEDTFVDFDASLNTAVNKLRRALGDTAERPAFIETVGRQGYRYVGPQPLPLPTSVPIARVAASKRNGRTQLLWVALGVVVLGAVSVGMILLENEPLPVSRVIVPTEPISSITLNLDSSRSIAISPDGRRLVYVAEGDDGTRRLYLRDMDVLEASPIPGTERPYGPFFSPDGRWVGFVTNRLSSGMRLKKIAVDGSSPIELCPVERDFWGATWGADDKIIFADWPVLYEIDSDGGEPKALTELLDGELVHGYPHALPDRKGVLYTAFSGSFGSLEQPRVMVRPTGGSSRLLLKGASNPMFAQTGHLVFTRDGTLMASPFDADTLELLGPATPLVDEVKMSRYHAAQVGFSLTGTLLYITGEKWSSQRKLVWVDRQGREEDVMEYAHPFAGPRISPDGNQIAFFMFESDLQVWTYDIARGYLNQRTHEGQNFWPIWISDGNRIAFQGLRPDPPLEVYSLPDDGVGGISQLTTNDFAEKPFGVTPDGQWLVAEVSQDIRVLPLRDGGEGWPVRDTNAVETEPALSRDAKWIAYSSDETGRFEIYVEPFPHGLTRWRVSDDGGGEPVWGPNERELFYRSSDGDRIMVVDFDVDPHFSPHAPRLLIEGDYEQVEVGRHNFDIAPDGRRFVVLKSAGMGAPTQIHVVLNWFEEMVRRTSSE